MESPAIARGDRRHRSFVSWAALTSWGVTEHSIRCTHDSIPIGTHVFLTYDDECWLWRLRAERGPYWVETSIVPPPALSNATSPEFFERYVAPLLVALCQDCEPPPTGVEDFAMTAKFVYRDQAGIPAGTQVLLGYDAMRGHWDLALFGSGIEKTMTLLGHGWPNGSPEFFAHTLLPFVTRLLEESD